MLFNGEVVLVTGAARGIGLAVAQAFAKEGAKVIIIDRDQQMAQDAAKGLRDQGHQADGFDCDVTSLGSVQETVNKILDIHQCIDILVNNAGITRDNLLLRLAEEDWDEVIKVNLKGVFNVSKVVLKAMLKAQKGKVINIASVVGITGNAGQANYAASKAGVIAFSKSAAREFAHRNITVNAVAPGYIRTGMTDKLSETVKQKVLEHIPLGRFGQPSDVACACVFLASPSADYITGQTLVVDGGMVI